MSEGVLLSLFDLSNALGIKVNTKKFQNTMKFRNCCARSFKVKSLLLPPNNNNKNIKITATFPRVYVRLMFTKRVKELH